MASSISAAVGPPAAQTPSDLAPPDDDDAVAAWPPDADALPLLQTRRFRVDHRSAGERLDKALAALIPEVSRSRLRQWIEAGAVRVNGASAAVRQALITGDAIEVVPAAPPQALAFQPEAMPLSIVHEDATLIVLDKPPGLVVHPGAGNWSGTLLNGLLAHDPALRGVPRAGIVHRLDAGTSGLLVVARTAAAQLDLVRQLQARTVTREYWALVLGATAAAGQIDAPLARDPRNRLRFHVSRSPAARTATTDWRRIAEVRSGTVTLTWLACRLLTGRTHQIRVHLESIGHPLIGDPLYRRGLPAAPADGSGPPWANFGRQALHACKLALDHPVRQRRQGWFRAPPADLAGLLRTLGFVGCDGPVEGFDPPGQRRAP